MLRNAVRDFPETFSTTLCYMHISGCSLLTRRPFVPTRPTWLTFLTRLDLSPPSDFAGRYIFWADLVPTNVFILPGVSDPTRHPLFRTGLTGKIIVLAKPQKIF